MVCFLSDVHDIIVFDSVEFALSAGGLFNIADNKPIRAKAFLSN